MAGTANTTLNKRSEDKHSCFVYDFLLLDEIAHLSLFKPVELSASS